jgi:hypothetical protein
LYTGIPRKTKEVLTMRGNYLILAALAIAAAAALADGPYKVLKTAKVGGLGGFDYIYADDAGRRLYIPRGAAQGDNPTPARVVVYNLDTLEKVGEVPNTRANGAAVDPKSGHGFASSKPVTMWDTKTLAVIKTIDVQGQPERHPSRSLQSADLRAQPSDQGRHRDRRQGRHGARNGRSGRRAGAGGERRQGPRVRGDPGSVERGGN